MKYRTFNKSWATVEINKNRQEVAEVCPDMAKNNDVILRRIAHQLVKARREIAHLKKQKN